MASNPDSKPKEGGIPDIMRGIGNMLRIAILEYNSKASQEELTKVVKEISELKSGNDNLGARVIRLNQALQNAIYGWDYYYKAWMYANAQNAHLQQHSQRLQYANTQLGQRLQGAQQHIETLKQQNQDLQAQLAPLQQQLQQLNYQLQQAQDAIAAAQADTVEARAAAANAQAAAANAQAAADEAQAAANQAQERAQQANQAQADAETARAAAETAQQQAQDHVARLEAELRNQEGSAEEIQGLRAELETAQAAARAAADEAQRARDAEQAARAASETAQQSVIEKEAEVEQERLRLGNMAENAEAARAEAQRARDDAVSQAETVRAQIADAQRQARLATTRAANSAAEVLDLQKQLAQKEGLSQQDVATLNQRLGEAVRKANIEKAAVEEANVALRQQLEEQSQKARTDADAATNAQQKLAAELEGLRQQVGTTGNQNAALEAQIAAVEKQLAEANNAAKQRQQEAQQAKQRFDKELERVNTDTAAQVAEAQRRAEDLETQLKQEKENGNTTAVQRAALEEQLEQQRTAADDARKQLAEQQAAAKAAQQQAEEQAAAEREAAQTAQRQVVAANADAESEKAARKKAEDARKEAEERAAQQQSELDALRQELQTAQRNGEEVGSLKQQLAEKESEVDQTKNELEAQKLEAEKVAKEMVELEERNKQLEAAKLNASNQAEIALNENKQLADEKSRILEELQKLQEQLEALQSEKVAASNAQKDQEDEARRQKEKDFNDDKAALQARVRNAISIIEKMTDVKCKEQLLAPAKLIEREVNGLTLETFTDDLDKKVQDLSEATGDKIKTFVSMRKEENPRRITFDKTKKTVTTPAKAGGGESTKVWGPFSGVFDPENSNTDKYKEMRAGLLDDIPSKGTTVVIFGYGYSGSGKTYTLLGGYKDKEKTQWENGIAQLAIQEYIAAKCTVQMEKAFEMFSESYKSTLQKFDYGTEIPKKEDIFDSKLPLVIASTSDFDGAYSKITIKRKSKGRITATPNNPESSRGHLFIVLKVTNGETEGRLIICDMGGRENPNEMWTNSEYVTITKKDTKVQDTGKQTYTVIRPVSKSDTTQYYDEDGTEKSIPENTPRQVISKVIGKGSLSMAFQGTSLSEEKTEILKTLKQGFYINDSINEMLAEFGYNSEQRDSNWSRSEGTDTYNPDVRALSVAGLNKKKGYNKENDKIGIRELFQEFREKSKCKIKFCTFACIRSPTVFFEDSIKTLQFAEAVNSVILAAPSSLPAAAAAAPHVSRIDPASREAAGRPTGANPSGSLTGPGAIVKSNAISWESGKLSQQPSTSTSTSTRGNGGSIRRQRRKKHAIFKTLKKSRLGFSASDSALASDSNSVKVKHKTRNHKKHNTRNNTVKK